jgi:hypothetical protein
MCAGNKTDKSRTAGAYFCYTCGSEELRCIGRLGMLVWFRCQRCGTQRPAMEGDADNTDGNTYND